MPQHLHNALIDTEFKTGNNPCSWKSTAAPDDINEVRGIRKQY